MRDINYNASTCPSDLNFLKSKEEGGRGRDLVYEMLGKILNHNRESKCILGNCQVFISN